MVNLTLRVLSKPDVEHLPEIFKTLGLDYDERVLPSIGNEVLKAVVVSCSGMIFLCENITDASEMVPQAQFNADQLLTDRPHVSCNPLL